MATCVLVYERVCARVRRYVCAWLRVHVRVFTYIVGRWSAQLMIWIAARSRNADTLPGCCTHTHTTTPRGNITSSHGQPKRRTPCYNSSPSYRGNSNIKIAYTNTPSQQPATTAQTSPHRTASTASSQQYLVIQRRSAVADKARGRRQGQARHRRLGMARGPGPGLHSRDVVPHRALRRTARSTIHTNAG